MIDCAKHNLTMSQFACFLLCTPVTEARENVDDQFAISFGVAFDWLSVARVIIGDAKRRRAKLNGSNAHLFFFSVYRYLFFKNQQLILNSSYFHQACNDKHEKIQITSS